VLVAEVLVLEVDASPTDPVTAMLRLEADVDVDVATPVNRAGFDVAVRVTRDAWKAAAGLGLVPDERFGGLAPPTLLEMSHAPPTVIVPVRDESWCGIFWWLC